MCRLLGCKDAYLPDRYLGISLGANPKLVKTWKPVIDMVEEKLSLWKAKSLNKAGKLVLIKPVLNSLPIYYLSLYKMPKAVAEKITSLVPTRGGPWKDICQLQIREPQVREKMIRGLAMELGDGKIICFWEDSWLPCGVLKVIFPRLFSVSNLQGSVIGDCGFWDVLEWIWNFQWRRELFQWELELVLQAEVLPADITSYSFTSTIWRGFVPPRVELFTWFALVGRMNTKKRLCRLGVIGQNDNMCVLCHKSIETAFHLFIGCELKQHYESWMDISARKMKRKQWLVGFFAVIWTIWLERTMF
ncbi:uncharacterized protein [Arachis hypogaea]|uniref:uncharacterized protein n=1 Tax=Arachis hypogaea TaxID=3818 RepID=UPI003B20F849